MTVLDLVAEAANNRERYPILSSNLEVPEIGETGALVDAFPVVGRLKPRSLAQQVSQSVLSPLLCSPLFTPQSPPRGTRKVEEAIMSRAPAPPTPIVAPSELEGLKLFERAFQRCNACRKVGRPAGFSGPFFVLLALLALFAGNLKKLG